MRTHTHAGAGGTNEVLNSTAVAVMTRMSDKLMGRDYTVDGMSPPTENDSVVAQVISFWGNELSVVAQVLDCFGN